MSEIHDQICPWCQTEIVWDPEIGAEKECPHCFNELGDYRSLNLQVKQTGESTNLAEEDGDEGDFEDDFDDDFEDDFGLLDEYEEAVQHIVDSQEEASECPSCRSLMLFAGTQTASPAFVPYVHESLKQPILNASFSVQLYVCPSCFRVEQQLAEAEQLAMTELLKQAKS